MLDAKTIVSKITKHRVAELKTFIAHYRSSFALSKTDEIELLAVLESAGRSTDEAIRLFEELEIHPREILSRFILNKHKKMAVNRINNVEINGEMYEIDHAQSKKPEIGDLVVGKSDFSYDWESMSLVVKYATVIEIWGNGRGITKDGGYDPSLFMEEAFVLRKVTI